MLDREKQKGFDANLYWLTAINDQCHVKRQPTECITTPKRIMSMHRNCICVCVYFALSKHETSDL